MKNQKEWFCIFPAQDLVLTLLRSCDCHCSFRSHHSSSDLPERQVRRVYPRLVPLLPPLRQGVPRLRRYGPPTHLCHGF
jgi:hypothetical protein